MNPQIAARHAASPQTPPLPQAKPETLGLSPVRLQRMSDAFKREIDKGTLPGATIMLARKGQIGWFDALGKQNPATSAPMAHDSIFRIFSMTKPIVSLGISRGTQGVETYPISDSTTEVQINVPAQARFACERFLDTECAGDRQRHFANLRHHCLVGHGVHQLQ